MGLFTYLIRIVLHFNKQKLELFYKRMSFFVFAFYRSHTLNIFWKIVNFSMKIWLANLSLLECCFCRYFSLTPGSLINMLQYLPLGSIFVCLQYSSS